MGDDGRRDLIAERVHTPRRGTHEGDAECGELAGQGRVLGRVAPAGPHSVTRVAVGDVGDEVDVGEVVVVRAAGHLGPDVGHADVLGVSGDVFGSGHGDKLDGPLVAEGLVCPDADGADGLDGGDAVVGDEDLADGNASAAAADEACEGIIRQRRGGGGGGAAGVIHFRRNRWRGQGRRASKAQRSFRVEA